MERSTYQLGRFDWMLIAGITICSILYAVFTEEAGKGFDCIGVAAAVTGLFSVVLTAHQKRSNYIFGIVNVVLYAWISFKANLLGDFLLYAVYYFPMQIIGWMFWSRHSIQNDRTVVSPGKMTVKSRILYGTLSTVAVVLFGMLLSWLKAHAQTYPLIEQWHLFSEYPYRDSLTTVFAIVAQYLMVKAYAEQWFFWLAIDVVSIIIWTCFLFSGTEHAGLMVIMYVFYLANCINGMRLWMTSSSQRNQQ